MRKLGLFIILLTVIAALVGIFGQDIAYFLGETVAILDPIRALTMVTILSISLFLFTFILATIFFMQQRIDTKVYLLLIVLLLVIGILVTIWSLFVLAMWWG